MSGGDADEMIDRLLEIQQRGVDPESSELWRSAECACSSPSDMLLRMAAASLEQPQRSDRALGYAERAVEFAPDDPAVLTRAASVQFYVGRFSRAKELLRAASQVASPDFPLSIDIIFLTGRIAQAQGNVDAARHCFVAAFEADPGGIGHARELAGLLIDQRDWVAALDVVTRALELRGGDPELTELRHRIMTGMS